MLDMYCRLLVTGFLLCAVTAGATSVAPNRSLRIYGPGGPHPVMQECAERFALQHGIEVEVVKALPHTLGQRLSADGDIYYGGAEYMLEEFDTHNPGILDLTSVEMLHPRRIGVIVRKGNPHNIRTAGDLVRNGIDLLDVKLENMRLFHGGEDGQSQGIRRFVYTGQEGMKVWRSSPEIDAWVTYRSWYVKLGGDAEFVEIPGEAALRYTPIALTRRTPHRREAMLFLDFLKSDQGREIFIRHGWD